jgi:hypothetical protein
VEAENFGLNFRLAQSATWKRLETDAVAPGEPSGNAPVIVPMIDIGLQFVGLKVNSGRSI